MKKKILLGLLVVVTGVLSLAFIWPNKTENGIEQAESALDAVFQVVDEVENFKQ